MDNSAILEQKQKSSEQKSSEQKSSEQFRNVHIYDGQLKGMFFRESTWSDAQKVTIFNYFKKQISNTDAIACVEMITNDLQSGRNFDVSNQIDASDVLVHILKLSVLTDDMISILEEQLADCNKLGQCPQGRVTRLIQVYNIVFDK
jgi:hypothetical protein